MKLPLLLTLFAAVVGSQAQPAGPVKGPAFEVASVRPSNPSPADPMSGVPRLMPVGGRLTVASFPLRLLIRVAYDVQDFRSWAGPPICCPASSTSRPKPKTARGGP